MCLIILTSRLLLLLKTDNDLLLSFESTQKCLGAGTFEAGVYQQTCPR